MENELLIRFVEKYCLDEIDPDFILEGISSCLEDCDCDAWLEKYLKDLLTGLRFHALKMRVRGEATETFEHILRTNAVRAINIYCSDNVNEIFLIPETDKKYPAFSLTDPRLWRKWTLPSIP